MLCCVCLGETANGMGIFDVMGEQLKIAEIMHKHLWFKPQPNDENHSNICHVCWRKLGEFHEFYQQAERAHAEHEMREKALMIKEEEALTSGAIKLENDEEMYANEILQYEVEIDVNAKDDGGIKDERISKNPLDEDFHNKEIEGTIDAYLEQHLDTNQTDMKSNYFDADNDEDVSDSETISDDYEPSEISDNECSSEEDVIKEEGEQDQLEENEIKPKVKQTRNRKSRKDKPTSEADMPKKKRKVIYKFDHDHTEEMILKHIPMGCILCVFVGKTFADIVQHFKEYHPKVRAHIVCCDKKLTKRFYVAQHALRHEDPNSFKCNECNKSFTTTCGLRAHNLNYHAPEEERTYCCDLCPKKFARPNLLELHKPSHIPRDQWQFFCTKCPTTKSFASEYLLNVHTSMQHKRAKNICHVCAKEIRDKHSFEKHVRLHFEDSGPRVPCPYPDCESWLKDEDNLKQHLKRHNPEGVTYKCTECNKVCKNRRALTNHKRYTHSNETFPCEQCDKTFKKAISLREHMTQHTGETLYKCPFCPRTFNSNANMHAHKKRQHPIEWDEWRRNKKGSAQALITQTNPLKLLDGI